MLFFTCPFCIRTYPKWNILRVCPSCQKPDPSKLHAMISRKCRTDKCFGQTTTSMCPYCHQIIPKTALETPNLPFSIVGVSNSGKTNYITVMLHELANSSGLQLALGHQTQYTLNHQKDNRSLIYDQHALPDHTPPNQIQLLPQIWYIKNMQKQRGHKVPTYTFTIFDGAGEDHSSAMDPASPVRRYVNASKAIILAVDPLILQNVRKGGIVDANVMRHSLGGENAGQYSASDVINGVAQYIKSVRGISSARKLDIPVAVVLMKIDTVLDHPAFGPNALIRSRSMSVLNGKVNLSEIRQVDGEIRNWLMQIGEQGFIETISSHFSEFYFFGVSSYGAPPVDDKTLPAEIRPHRVLDPILWLFHRAGFLD